MSYVVNKTQLEEFVSRPENKECRTILIPEFESFSLNSSPLQKKKSEGLDMNETFLKTINPAPLRTNLRQPKLMA